MDKKDFIKNIILELHKGLSVEEAKERLLKEIGEINTTEIAEIEQSLINEGMSVDEIKKFCNVHSLLFQSMIKQDIIKENSTSHPIYFFKQENREIEKILENLKQKVKNNDIDGIKNILLKLKEVDVHYTRKEQLLFPFLEKYGFYGPSKVMWGKDNEIRELLKKVIANYNDKDLNLLIEEIEGMIFKEENILFPTSLEKLTTEDWISILKESNNVGYAFIIPPKDIEMLIKEFESANIEIPEIKDNKSINLPSGNLSLEEIMCIFNTLPVDITFVDKEDKVKYFSEGKERIFLRTRSVVGRKVQYCHPPQSVDKVEKILNDFKSGKRDVAEFWINFKGRLIYIRYFAVRNKNREYLGTLEVTQDITKIKTLEGEKRLLDEKN